VSKPVSNKLTLKNTQCKQTYCSIKRVCVQNFVHPSRCMRNFVHVVLGDVIQSTLRLSLFTGFTRLDFTGLDWTSLFIFLRISRALRFSFLFFSSFIRTVDQPDYHAVSAGQTQLYTLCRTPFQWPRILN